MCKSLDLFMLISCFFLTAESQTGQILPPQNVSLRWISDFCVELAWAQTPGCKYKAYKNGYSYALDEAQWRTHIIMNGGFAKLSVKTSCVNGTESAEVPKIISNPELVKDLRCYIYSAEKAYCSWSVVTHAPDLRFYYELVDESPNSSSNDVTCSTKTKECSVYNSTDGVRTGCSLKANISHEVHILFNGTVNNTCARNTFLKPLKDDVRPPALYCSVKKNKNALIISWSHPGITCSSGWEYTVKYTECNKSKNVQVTETSYRLLWIPRCPYRMSVKAKCEHGETPWSEEIYLEADDPNALVSAAVLIPLLVACLVALTFAFFWKFKKVIFPKVPEPPQGLFEGISDNNNQNIIGKMCVTTEEEESCKITLVADPEIGKQD